MQPNAVVALARDIEATGVPYGEKETLRKGGFVRVLQELGGSFTVMDPIGRRFRIEGTDADAIGREPLKESQAVKVDPTDPNAVEKAVWAQLRTIHDPEIPFNIVDVGLIYECKLGPSKLGDGWDVYILMTLTAPGCGMGDVIVNDVRMRVGSIPGVQAVDVNLTADPPWSIEMLSPAARMALNL